mmetsp:Transcript_16720/g.41825  ORF Transcript_16720/g.41825 Transcript_16720/m.41825 type:complete len:282 (+) Transcript_16720:1143-1988(+)
MINQQLSNMQPSSMLSFSVLPCDPAAHLQQQSKVGHPQCTQDLNQYHSIPCWYTQPHYGKGSKHSTAPNRPTCCRTCCHALPHYSNDNAMHCRPAASLATICLATFVSNHLCSFPFISMPGGQPCRAAGGQVMCWQQAGATGVNPSLHHHGTSQPTVLTVRLQQEHASAAPRSPAPSCSPLQLHCAAISPAPVPICGVQEGGVRAGHAHAPAPAPLALRAPHAAVGLERALRHRVLLLLLLARGGHRRQGGGQGALPRRWAVGVYERARRRHHATQDGRGG